MPTGRMHITIYYPGKKPVPPPLYGGGQRVMYWLGKALVQLGHRVTLIAHPDSHIPGAELRPLRNLDPADDSWERLIPDSTDILHLRHAPARPLSKPFIITIGGNGRPGEKFHPNTIFVSKSHAANHGSRHYVHNGLDPDDYSFSKKRGDYAVFLAKVRWKVKNFHGAVRAARDAGLELRVLGSRNWPLNLQRLLPPIRGVRYYGMIGGQEKRDLLAHARCLIFPVRWEEPGANALNEALASGCYVAGTPYGCLPEIVTPDVGVLSARAGELADAVRHPERFDPGACRNRVLRGGLTHLDMAKNYLRHYEAVLTHGRLGEASEPAPVTQPGFMANQLLPWED